MATADLKAIIRVRKWEVDEKRRELGLVLDQEAAIEDRQRALEAEVIRENAALPENIRAGGIGEAMTLGAYAARALERRRALAEELDAVRRRIEAMRDELADMFKDLKTFELAQEARELAARKEADRKEQIVLDEIGMDLFRRRTAADGNSGS